MEALYADSDELFLYVKAYSSYSDLTSSANDLNAKVIDIHMRYFISGFQCTSGQDSNTQSTYITVDSWPVPCYSYDGYCKLGPSAGLRHY